MKKEEVSEILGGPGEMRITAGSIKASKLVFNLENLPFGTAIQYMKMGRRIARKGWNGKNMFVVYQKGYPEGIPCNKQTAEAWGMKEGDLFKVRPYMQLRTAQGDHAMWAPSGSDVLAEDWEVID